MLISKNEKNNAIKRNINFEKMQPQKSSPPEPHPYQPLERSIPFLLIYILLLKEIRMYLRRTECFYRNKQN